MNPDAFEYYFELEELTPLADVPLADLLRNAIPSQRGTKAGSATVPRELDRPSTVAANEARSEGNRSPPETTRSEQTGWGATRARNEQVTAKPTPRDAPTKSLKENWERTPAQPSPDTRALGESDVDAEQERVATHPRSPVITVAPAVNYPKASNAASAPAPEAETHGESSPWLNRMSVHVLGQFAFCHRAGIHSAENGDETDLDESQPQWAYLPNFDLERIDEQLAQLLRQSWILLGLILIFILGMVGGVAIQDRRIFYPALVGAIVCLVSLVNTGRMVLTLLWRRAAARRAVAREPSLTIDRIESVNWWSLLKAGFEPVAYQRQFRHPHLALEGSPWRVLERGSLRIPVVKSGAGKLGDAKHAIYPKHEIRLAAYAVLLEATEHVQVPYGIIFPADSHLGLAIPITESLRAQVVEHLERANGLLVRSQRGESEPRPPADRKRCATCRLGDPVPISDTDIKRARKARIPLHVLADRMDRTYHCACADRFGSAPSHRRIIQLGLRSTVE